jgi:hypothetical protein
MLQNPTQRKVALGGGREKRNVGGAQGFTEVD